MALIDRDATLERMKSMAGCATCDNYNWVRCRACSWDDAMNIVDELPIVAAIPVIHAWWKDKGNETVSCSRCATWFPKERKPYLLYCGYCGAKMDGERRAEP